MAAHNSRTPCRGMFAVVALLLGLALACGSPTMVATVNLYAEEVAEIVRGETVSITGEDWRYDSQRVEFYDDYLRIFGEYHPGTGAPLAGSLDVALIVEDGVLKAQVIAVDFSNGGSLPDERLQQINSQLSNAFAQAVAQGREELEFESAKITPEAIRLMIRFMP